MQQPLPLSDFMLQLLHATTVFFELLAITPTVSGMLLEFRLQLLHQTGLGENLARQVVLRGGHVVASGHMGHSQSELTTGLIPMADLARPLQDRRNHPIHLKAAQFGVKTDDALTGQQNPNVVVRQTEQSGELAWPIHFFNNHCWGDPSAKLG